MDPLSLTEYIGTYSPDPGFRTRIGDTSATTVVVADYTNADPSSMAPVIERLARGLALLGLPVYQIDLYRNKMVFEFSSPFPVLDDEEDLTGLRAVIVDSASVGRVFPVLVQAERLVAATEFMELKLTFCVALLHGEPVTKIVNTESMSEESVPAPFQAITEHWLEQSLKSVQELVGSVLTHKDKFIAYGSEPLGNETRKIFLDYSPGAPSSVAALRRLLVSQDGTEEALSAYICYPMQGVGVRVRESLGSLVLHNLPEKWGDILIRNTGSVASFTERDGRRYYTKTSLRELKTRLRFERKMGKAARIETKQGVIAVVPGILAYGVARRMDRVTGEPDGELVFFFVVEDVVSEESGRHWFDHDDRDTAAIAEATRALEHRGVLPSDQYGRHNTAIRHLDDGRIEVCFIDLEEWTVRSD